MFCLAEIAASLAAHGAKKLGIQTMGDLMSMTIQDISMRGGWTLKSFNTFLTIGLGHLPLVSDQVKLWLDGLVQLQMVIMEVLLPL